jgi:hypothetical protein
MNQHGDKTTLPKATSPAFGWNVAVIVAGVLIAVCAILAWAGAPIRDSAWRQTVAALWLIQGLLGLLIAAVGVLGATLVSVLNTRMESRAEPETPPRPPLTKEVGPLHPARIRIPESLEFTDAVHQLNAESVKILENAISNNYSLQWRHDTISLSRYGTLLAFCRTNRDIGTFGVQNGLTD